MFNETKYKDDSPINTVDKIKNILYSYNLIPIESNWKNSVDGYYSLSVSIRGTKLATNGKGTSIEYALASAYGELMERLQNQSFYRLSIDLGPGALNYLHFFYAPDERYTSIKDFLILNEEWTQIQMALLDNKTDIKKLFNRWKMISYEDTPNELVTIPYLNLMTKNISNIPVKMVSKMYMSNGMCAGNTIEEALVQGLSEVFERYVNRKIVLEKICPPTIPREYLKQCPRIMDMISRIEQKGNYKVIMKDCSLGKNYPVVGAIFINRDNQHYFVKFGSHPQMEIAMERTLTELLQGQDVNQMMGIKEYSYNPPIVDEDKNLMGILVNGSGYYQSEFFSKNYSYPFNDYSMPKESSNKDMMIHLLNLLRRENYHVFVRDVSYLGFPSYHMIVPGFSEVEKIDDFKTLDEYVAYIKIKQSIRNIDKLSDDGIIELIGLMDKYDIHGEGSILQFLSFNIEDTYPWYYQSIDLFRVALNYKVGNFKKAYNILDNYLSYMIVNKFNHEIYTFYKCVRDYMGTKINHLSKQDCINALAYFYPKNMINDVIEKFNQPDLIFNQFGLLHCWQCDKCPKLNTCSYQNLKQVYMVLKDIYNINFIDQRNII
ncbi:YcaO-like family protein [Mycoplasmatota bacterium]|nr:YcaO-like family protein [Mycoplasmatota bacterium]